MQIAGTKQTSSSSLIEDCCYSSSHTINLSTTSFPPKKDYNLAFHSFSPAVNKPSFLRLTSERKSNQRTMSTPTITFVRHAQGFHNLSTANHSMRDPLLTDLGKTQCQTLHDKFPYSSEVDCIVASPLKRTIYTAMYSFPAKTKELGIITLPDVQETSDLPCDTGSDKKDILTEFANKGVQLDLHLLTDDWHSKKGRSAPEQDAIETRTRDARKWLKARKEKHIVVVVC